MLWLISYLSNLSKKNPQHFSQPLFPAMGSPNFFVGLLIKDNLTKYHAATSNYLQAVNVQLIIWGDWPGRSHLHWKQQRNTFSSGWTHLQNLVSFWVEKCFQNVHLFRRSLKKIFFKKQISEDCTPAKLARVPYICIVYLSYSHAQNVLCGHVNQNLRDFNCHINSSVRRSNIS